MTNGSRYSNKFNSISDFYLDRSHCKEMRRQREGTVLGTPLSDLGYTAKYRYATNMDIYGAEINGDD
jgi:hypothetical protein